MKLIVSDLDGTLLNKWHISSPAIDKCVATIAQSQTADFVVATGRHLFTNHLIGLSFIHHPIYKIAMNGALVKDKTDQILMRFPLDQHFVTQLVNQFPQVSFELITERGVYVSEGKWAHFRQMTRGKTSLNRRIKYLVAAIGGGFYYHASLPLPEPVLKIDCHIGDATLASEVNAFIEQSSWAVNSGPNLHNFEITAKQVNKLTGLSWLTNYLQVAASQVAVYGNDLNDVEMLAGYTASFVPKNAVAAAKQAATHTLACENGLALAQHMVLQATQGDSGD